MTARLRQSRQLRAQAFVDEKFHAALPRRGTRVVIVLGTHDALDSGEDGAANYIHRVREIAGALARRAAEVVWVGPPCILPGHPALDDRRVKDAHDRIAEAIAALPDRNVR